MGKSRKIVITGGAGFVGTNLINFLLKKTNFNIISIDNYSSGFRKNHVKNTRVKYIKANTKNMKEDADILMNRAFTYTVTED